MVMKLGKQHVLESQAEKTLQKEIGTVGAW